jgi:DNA polymerase-3 subunit beta
MTATATRTRITIEVKPFHDALSAIQGVIPPRSPKPILQNFLLRADPDEGSTLVATDMEIGVTHRVIGIRADAPATLVLDPRRFGGWLRATRDASLDLYLDENGIEVRGPTSKFQMSTEDPTLYPTIPEFPGTPGHELGAADLRRLIRRTVYATDVESTRYALGGTLWERGPDSLALVGTDGRRLAHATAAAGAPGWPTDGNAGMPVVPVKAMKLLDRILDDPEERVTIVIPDANCAFVRTERATVYTRLVEGRFPRYQDVFPRERGTRIPFEAGTLLAAVEQAAIATSEESRGLDFRFADGLLKIEARAADVGNADVELPVAFEGPPLTVTFDGRYLADMLKVLDESTALDLYLIDGKNAVVFETADGLRTVIMPLTRET